MSIMDKGLTFIQKKLTSVFFFVLISNYIANSY